MSFFVSEAIKDRLTQNELIEEVVNKIDSNFYINIVESGEKFSNSLTSIERIDNDSCYCYLETNNVVFEKIFFKKVKISEIVIGNTKQTVSNFEFLIGKKEENNFLIKLLLEMRS
tara:strand:- start:203 stop:547 length:345 start_codon:yes stop_codon:yes gene_type:complete